MSAPSGITIAPSGQDGATGGLGVFGGFCARHPAPTFHAVDPNLNVIGAITTNHKFTKIVLPILGNAAVSEKGKAVGWGKIVFCRSVCLFATTVVVD